MSLGLGCAGCHPDGRDDGHVWFENEVSEAGLRGSPLTNVLIQDRGGPIERITGQPRQTPMLAGRVAPAGPYGWHGESATLEARIMVGFRLHRWFSDPFAWPHPPQQAQALATFLRDGLVPPPVEHRALSDVELRGKAVFETASVGCSGCHPGSSGFTDRTTHPLGLGSPESRMMAADTKPFRTPSLLFVGGTPPYFHDGRVTTLPLLVESIGTKMGDTSSLSSDDKAALAAYLATIGTVSGDAAPPPSPPFVALPFAPRLPVDAKLAAPPTTESAFAKEPPPSGVSPPPAVDEWTKVPSVKIDRSHTECTVKRIREWVWLSCPASDCEFIVGDAGGNVYALDKLSARFFPYAKGIAGSSSSTTTWRGPTSAAATVVTSSQPSSRSPRSGYRTPPHPICA